MDWLIPALIGWCGTGWPWRIPIPRGGGGTDPDNPWPDNCPMCGGIIGALSAVLVVILLQRNAFIDNVAGLTIVSLAAGKVGSDIVGTVLGMARRK